MGAHFFGDEEVVAAEEYFGHDVALVAEVFEVIFGAEVVETVNAWLEVVEGVFAVFVYDGVSVVDEFEAEVAAGLEYVSFAVAAEMVEQVHETCFTAADGSGKKESFFKVDVEEACVFFVVDDVDEDFIDGVVVGGMNVEMRSVEGFSAEGEAVDAFIEMVHLRGVAGSFCCLGCGVFLRRFRFLVFHGY